jgi:ribosomal protein L31E
MLTAQAIRLSCVPRRATTALRSCSGTGGSSVLQSVMHRSYFIPSSVAAASVSSSRPIDFLCRHRSTTVEGLGVVEKPLRALDMAAVNRIKEELARVDVNSDGRYVHVMSFPSYIVNICTMWAPYTHMPSSLTLPHSLFHRLDSDELKNLLKMHTDVFSDEEIVELGELYYGAKAGGSVRFDNFIEAVDLVAAKSASAKAIIADGDSIPKHFFEGERHPMGIGRESLEYMNLGKSHGHYTDVELNVELTHLEPKTFVDQAAYRACQAVRFLFDAATGWRMDNIKVDNTLNRVIYLETIAAVPGMVAAVVRHFRSLRQMKTDGGMLQLFLEEANNERYVVLNYNLYLDGEVTELFVEL